ncbi:MAG: glycosyltransferase, partial [Oscillospiraceae bacterium]
GKVGGAMAAISVIVPVYNAEAFLRKCTDSVIAQRFSDWELLLIDDGSTDGSAALCDAIAGEDGRVRVFHQENGGVSTARNRGLSLATGDWIAFADSDDWLEPDCLQLLWDTAQNAGADSAGCAHRNVTPSGESWEEAAALPPGVYGKEEIFAGLVLPLVGDRVGAPVVNGFIWRFLFSRRILTEYAITFDGAYLEDELFLIEYFCRAEKLAMTDAPLYCYLQNPTSVTRKYMRDYLTTFDRFMEKKEALIVRFHLGERRPHWRENSNFAGLLIAIGNEYATGNPASSAEKQAQVERLCARPDMAEAIRTVRPERQSRNKQLVTTLVRHRLFGLLTLLYRIKNRG